MNITVKISINNQITILNRIHTVVINGNGKCIAGSRDRTGTG